MVGGIMKSCVSFVLLNFIVFFNSVGFTNELGVNSRLIIHAADFGVGKFHRYDNKIHTYAATSSWLPYILPADVQEEKPFVRDNVDGSVTIFFSTLDELIQNIVQISKNKKMPVSVLNINAHGLPGTLWFPPDETTLNDLKCEVWKGVVSGSDLSNYSQYYSGLSESDILAIRQIAENINFQADCSTGLNEWKKVLEKTPELKSIFSPDAQIHFLSCVVGLGTVGERFVKGIAELLLVGSNSYAVTSMNFGLGDWSMPEGMGFWDFQNKEQLHHDNEIYIKNKTDREIMQKGTVRIATYSSKGWSTQLFSGLDFMSTGFETNIPGTPTEEVPFQISQTTVFPTNVRIPGTHIFVKIMNGK